MLVTVIGRVSSKSRFIQLFSLCRE